MSVSTLFVSNFPFSTTEPELRALFESHTPVRSLRIVTDRESGRSRGFAFIEVPEQSDCDAAIEALHETMLNGRRLVVSLARGRASSQTKAPNAGAASASAEPFRHRIVVEWAEEERRYTAEVPELGVSARADSIHDAVREVQKLTQRQAAAAGAG